MIYTVTCLGYLSIQTFLDSCRVIVDILAHALMLVTCRIAMLHVSIRLVCLLTGMHVLTVTTKDEFEVIQVFAARPFCPI